MQFRFLAALLLLGVGASSAALADYPDKPITLIVPFAAGGSTDQTARMLAKAAEADLGQPIIVVNKPGASTALGTAEIAKAKPDGYTIGTLNTTLYLLPLQGREVPYNPLTDFTFISYYGDNLIGVAVRADAPWKTLQDLIDDGKKNPGKLKYATTGVGTTQHLTAEALQLASGARFTHIPQQGGSAASMPALLGGHVDFLVETSVWAPFVEDKQVRLLAVTTPTRSERFADAPTLNELGYKSSRSIQGILGPAGIPEEARAKLEKAFRKALSNTTFREAMGRLSMQIVDLSGADTKAMVLDEYARAKTLLTEIGKAK